MATPEITVQAHEALFRYCKGIDDHDAAALAAVFSEDVLLVAGPPGDEQSFPGRDVVVSILASLFEQRKWARHLIANVLVNGDPGGDVQVSAYGHFWLGTEGGVTEGLADYRITMRETDGGLLITRLAVSIVHQHTIGA